MMARRVILALGAVLAAAMPLWGQSPGIFSQEAKTRLPVPGQAAQDEALRLVGEVYKADYNAAKTTADKQALAGKLLQGVAEAQEPASRYVLMKVARDVAAQAGDAALAFQAVDAMAAAFDVDAFAAKSEALETASRTAGSAELQRAVVDGALGLLDEAGARDDFEAAARLGRFAQAATRRTHDPALTNKVTARVREIEKAARAYRKVKIALETLDTSPADPESNLTVGRYLCLVKGDWAKGLAMLALGSDEALKALAVRELRGPGDAASQAALGDGWWDLAQAEQGTAKSRLEARAGHWYHQALPNLTGLVKAKIEKRLEEAEPQRPSATPKHILDRENWKQLAFLDFIGNSWNNDARRDFSIQKAEGAYTITCNSLTGHIWRLIVLPNRDISAEKMVASFTIQHGRGGIGVRPKTFVPEGEYLIYGPGEKHRVELWIQGGRARALVDGVPEPIPKDDPSNYGFFCVVVSRQSVVTFHELAFEPLGQTAGSKHANGRQNPER